MFRTCQNKKGAGNRLRSVLPAGRVGGPWFPVPVDCSSGIATGSYRRAVLSGHPGVLPDRPVSRLTTFPKGFFKKGGLVFKPLFPPACAQLAGPQHLHCCHSRHPTAKQETLQHQFICLYHRAAITILHREGVRNHCSFLRASARARVWPIRRPGRWNHQDDHEVPRLRCRAGRRPVLDIAQVH